MLVLLGATGCAAKPATPVDNWVVVETEHVRLRAELPVSAAQDLASEMQEIRDAFASDVLQCAFARDMGRIEVTALPRDQFERIAPANSGAYYQSYGASWIDYPPQIVIPATFEGKSRQTFQHELTHRLNAICFPNAPIWVNEGLAEFLETALVQNGKLSIGLPPYLFVSPNERFNHGEYLGQRIQIVPRDFVPSIPKLLELDYEHFYSRTQSDEELKRSIGNYAAAWSLIHFLELGDPELQGRFARYLGVLRARNRTPEAAWKDEFGGIDLDKLIATYREREQMPYVDLKYRVRVREKPQIRSMRAGEAHLHWSWLLGLKFQELALAHASSAQKDPSSAALAQAMTASLYAENKQFGKAAAEIQKGLASTPNDARLLHAQLLLDLDVLKGMAKQGVFDDLIARLQPVARTASQLNALADAELARGNADVALQYTRRALVERPECWTCLVTQALVLVKLSQWSAALESLDLATRWISHNNSNALTSIRELAEKIRRRAVQR